MKKVILTAAIVLGGLSTYAMASPALNQTDEIVINVQDEFKEIKASELPQAVKDALAADFPTANLGKAYVNAEQENKLDLIIDETATTVYADKDGNWIDK